MKTRCPCCGAENSIDALIAHEQARQSMWTLANIGGPMTQGLVQYLGLFRPSKSSLSQARMYSLMSELIPDIRAGEIRRNGQVHPAPVAAWTYAFNEVLTARDSGRLKTPLKSHGYLYEIIAGWVGNTPVEAVPAAPAQPAQQQAAPSSTIQAAAAGEKFKR